MFVSEINRIKYHHVMLAALQLPSPTSGGDLQQTAKTDAAVTALVAPKQYVQMHRGHFRLISFPAF